MPVPDVVFALTGDVRQNSRALKQLRILARLGASVEVLCIGSTKERTDLASGLRLSILPRPQGSGPAFFAQVHGCFRRAVQRIPARVYHASDLYTLPALASAARRHDSRLAYDAREFYAHVAATAGRPWIRTFWRLVEGRYIRQADAVFTVSESIADRLAQRYAIPRPMLIYNVPPRQNVSASTYLRKHAGVADDQVLLLHQGQIQKDRGCYLLVDAMRDVRGAVLVFLGGGPLKPDLRHRVAEAGLAYQVRFLDPVPPDALLPVTASADAGITLLEDTCLNHRFALPNKLFEYLMAGLPVLGSDLPEIRRVVAGHGVGLLVNPADRDALVKALQRMVDDTEARARWRSATPRVFETFSWEEASQRFEATYRDLLSL